MSQMAASVESLGMNLMQSRLFLKACSSAGRRTQSESLRSGRSRRQRCANAREALCALSSLDTCHHANAVAFLELTGVDGLLDGDETHGQGVLYVYQLHVH